MIIYCCVGKQWSIIVVKNLYQSMNTMRRDVVEKMLLLYYVIQH